MKRFFSLVAADMRFQFRYGFYALYALLSAAYVVLVRALPQSWREIARALVVFSDPAAIGLMFMGVILLFEKGERVLSSLAVSPVGVGEYVASKCASLSFISAVSGFAIVRLSGGRPGLAFLAGVIGSSVVFSLAGVIVGSRARSINQFLVIAIPAELVVMAPSCLRLFGIGPAWLDVHPGSAAIALMTRSGSGAEAGLTAVSTARGFPPIVAAATLATWGVFLFYVASRSAKAMFGEEGRGERS